MGKSRASKPTLDQKKLIAGEGLNPKDWLVLRDLPNSLMLVHRSSGGSYVVEK